MNMAGRLADRVDLALSVGRTPCLEPLQDNRIDGNRIAADINCADRFRELRIELRAPGVLGNEGVENVEHNFAAKVTLAQDFADGRVAVNRIALETPVIVDAAQSQTAETTVDTDVGIIRENGNVDDLCANATHQPRIIGLIAGLRLG